MKPQYPCTTLRTFVRRGAPSNPFLRCLGRCKATCRRVRAHAACAKQSAKVAATAIESPRPCNLLHLDPSSLEHTHESQVRTHHSPTVPRRSCPSCEICAQSLRSSMSGSGSHSNPRLVFSRSSAISCISSSFVIMWPLESSLIGWTSISTSTSTNRRRRCCGRRRGKSTNRSALPELFLAFVGV